MSDQKDSRPEKQRRIHGIALLEQTSPVEDDEDSSSSSSSSSIQLPTTRLTHRLLKSSDLPPTESSSSGGEEGGEDEEETTSSSNSGDSESEDISEEEEDEESEAEDVEDAGDGHAAGRITHLVLPPGRTSDLKSRLQSFLPQLQQANKELEDSREVVEKRIDHVSDDSEHYIEMELGLGVLSEQDDDTTQIRLPHSPSGDEKENGEDDEIKDGQDGMENSVLSRLIGAKETKGIKRKIEEL